MKLIPLTLGQFAIVDDSDYEWLNQWHWAAKPTRSGFCARRSIRVGGKQRFIWMHREIAGTPDGKVCDHWNRNSLDNQRHNLREATNQQNGFNRGPTKSNTSGFKGVTFCRFSGRWKAQIEISGKNKHLGRFDSAEDAKKAYDEAAMRFHRGVLMPIIHKDVIQGTTEWAQLRSGIPTASAFDRILTPKGKISTQATKYMYDLLAERLMKHPIVEFTSHWQDRGSQTEAEAVMFYEFTRNIQTVKVGFITNEAGTIGASPNRLVGDEGLLEIKCPKESTHVSYLLTRAVDAEYYPQIQGQLWLSERKWADILSYHPEMPEALIHVERDEDFILKLEAAVTTFSLELERQWLICIEKGWATNG